MFQSKYRCAKIEHSRKLRQNRSRSKASHCKCRKPKDVPRRTCKLKQKSGQNCQLIKSQDSYQEPIEMDNSLYETITQSLFYPAISSRHEQITNEFDGIENSYEWIFEESSRIKNEAVDETESCQDSPRWANFSEWLRSASKIYWINGKAGSGKSTLMNYICGHRRTEELLKQWSAEKRLLTPKFFFWNAGVREQKTTEGLLRAIIYQILTECQELIACVKVSKYLFSWNCYSV